MYTTCEIELTRRVLRTSVCTECERNPLGHDYRSPGAQRPCESTCAIFQRLAALPVDPSDATVVSSDVPATRQVVCRHCSIRISGAVCSEVSEDDCPLGCFKHGFKAVAAMSAQD